MTTDDLRDLKKKHGLSQREMADMLGMGLSQYNALACGRTPIRKIHELALQALFPSVNEVQHMLSDQNMPVAAFNGLVIARDGTHVCSCVNDQLAQEVARRLNAEYHQRNQLIHDSGYDPMHSSGLGYIR